jgi:cytochrome P450
MSDFADRWGFGPDKFWLRGERKKEAIEFNEELGAWQVFDYPEAAEILQDTEAFTPNGTALFEVDEATKIYFEGDLAQMDGPEHVHMRKQVISIFNPRFMEHLESQIHSLAGEAIAKVAGRDEFDLLGDFIDDLAGIVFTKLLGIPSGQREVFDLVNQDMNHEVQMTGPEMGEGAEYFAELTAPLQPLRDMLGEQIDEHRKNPGDDLISLLTQVTKIDDSLMTRDQIINFIIGIIGAGHLSTPLLIGNTMLCLDSFPDQADRVRADHSLTTSMIDETMRFLTPGNATYRVSLKDAEVGGKKIPKDQLLRVELGSANRDPGQFPDADSYDVGRHPNPHLGFGRGAHYCLGQQLIRVETQIVFDLLMDHYPVLRVAPGAQPEFFRSPDFTGVSGLVVRTS